MPKKVLWTQIPLKDRATILTAGLLRYAEGNEHHTGDEHLAATMPKEAEETLRKYAPAVDFVSARVADAIATFMRQMNPELDINE